MTTTTRSSVGRLAVAALTLAGLCLVPTPASASTDQRTPPRTPPRTRYFQEDALAAAPERPADCQVLDNGAVGTVDAQTCAAMNATPVDMSAMFP